MLSVASPGFHLTYSDDGMVLAVGNCFELTIAKVWMWYRVLGISIDFDKLKGDLSAAWIGHWKDLRNSRLGLTESRVR